MADFKIAHSRTAIFEGGYSSVKEDNGNWTGGKVGVGILAGTNWGVTAKEYAKFLGRPVTMQDMKNMPKEHAEEIFKQNYWDPFRGDEIISQAKANRIFDMAVNAGIGTAIILTRRALKMPENTKMTQDVIDKLNNK